MGAIQEKLSSQVAEKLSASDRKMEELSAVVEGQKKSIADNSELVKDLMISVENFTENVKSINKQMDEWHNLEV